MEKTRKPICLLLALLMLFSLFAAGCDRQQAQTDDPTKPSAQTPEQNDPADPDPEAPQLPAEDPKPQVSPNPAIQTLLDTLNAALAENGHPITLAMKDPTAAAYDAELKILYTGEGTNPYAGHLEVSLYQQTEVLGQEYGEDFYCQALHQPSPEAEEAAAIIYTTALPLYDTAFNDKFVQSYVALSDDLQMDEIRHNWYGADASKAYDVIDERITIHTRQEIRGLQLWRHEIVSEEDRSISYHIRRLRDFRPVMSPIYRQDMLDALGQVYDVEGPLNIETDTEDWIGEYSDAIISHPEYGRIDIGFNSRMADEAIRVTSVRYDTEADAGKLDWYMDVCSRMLAFCGDQFSLAQQQEIIAAVRNLKDGEALSFESESRSMQVQPSKNGNYYVFIIRMEAGGDLLTEEELAEINTWFAWTPGQTEYPMGNSFLTCIYRQPSEINLFEVFGGHGDIDNQHGQLSDAERKALSELNEHFAAGYEANKIKRSSMEKILKANTGFGLKDNQWSDLEAFTYLKSYDAYYVMYGGTNRNAYTMVDGWHNPDGTLSLVYKNDRTVYETGYEYCVVTLKPAESGQGFHGYWFVSNLPYLEA